MGYKVAIWGSYNYGNYGDDLMALMYAKVLKKYDIDVWVYRLNPRIAEENSITTTDCIHTLIQGARFCIIGGGGFLTPGNVPMNSVDEDVERESLKLCHMALAEQCPIYGVSIGGSGQEINTTFHYGRSQLLSSAMFKSATVRLKEDVALLEAFGKKAYYFPDVVWAVSRFWNIQRECRNDRTFHIGLNLYDSRVSRRFIRLLCYTANVWNKLVLHFIRLHAQPYNLTYEIHIPGTKPRLHCYTYNNPYDTLKYLAGLDIVISSKLHFGVTALSLGIPFVSLGGQLKTRAFLTSIGAGHAIWNLSNKQIIKLYWHIIMHKARWIQEQYDFKTIEHVKEKSYQHISYLEKIISMYSA